MYIFTEISDLRIDLQIDLQTDLQLFLQIECKINQLFDIQLS